MSYISGITVLTSRHNGVANAQERERERERVRERDKEPCNGGRQQRKSTSDRSYPIWRPGDDVQSPVVRIFKFTSAWSPPIG